MLDGRLIRGCGKLLLSSFLAMILISCSQNAKVAGDPEGRLVEYISKSFSVNDEKDRMDLLAYLSGDAKTRLSAWSNEQFRNAFMETKREFLKLTVREVKPVSENETSITYELSYLDKSRGKGAKITNRKLAQMERENGVWTISKVKNIRELIEYQNEMSLP